MLKLNKNLKEKKEATKRKPRWCNESIILKFIYNCTKYSEQLTDSLITKTTSEYNSDDVTSKEGRTYTLNCNGVVGDMVYLTDLDYTANVGHNIAEVKIYEAGEKTTYISNLL